MKNEPVVKAARAIASVMVGRYLFVPITLLTVVMLIVTVATIVLAIVGSNWWILLSIASLAWFLVGSVLGLICYVIFTKIRPRKLNAHEKKTISSFVNDFGAKYAAASGIKKSPTALSALVAWKYVKGKGKQPVSAIVMEPLNETKALKTRFQEVVKLFS